MNNSSPSGWKSELQLGNPEMQQEWHTARVPLNIKILFFTKQSLVSYVYWKFNLKEESSSSGGLVTLFQQGLNKAANKILF